MKTDPRILAKLRWLFRARRQRERERAAAYERLVFALKQANNRADELQRQLDLYGKLDIHRQPNLNDCIRVQITIDARTLKESYAPIPIVNEVFARLQRMALNQLIRHPYNP